MIKHILNFILSLFNNGGSKSSTYLLQVTKEFRDFKVDEYVTLRTKHGINSDKMIVIKKLD